MYQVAVRAMDFHHVETGLIGASRRLSPGFHGFLDVRERHLPGSGISLRMGNSAGPDQFPFFPPVYSRTMGKRRAAFPRHRSARLAPGMAELNTRDRPVVLDQFGNPPHRVDIVILPQTQVAGRRAPARVHLGGFHENQPDSARSKLAEVHQVPVVHPTAYRRILEHRR